MSSASVLGSASTLISLPRPLDHDKGRIRAAPVHALAHGRLRKRHEAAVAVDGEAISIYDVQNPHVITSYALPPQTFSLTPPCSIRYRAKTNQPHRFTYAAVTNDNSRRIELLCFQEDGMSAEGTNATKNAVKMSSQSNVVLIQVVPKMTIGKTSASTHEVLVVQRDSNLTLLSGNTMETVFAQNLAGTDETREVVHAVALNSEECKNGFLRERDDILARLSNSAANDSQASFWRQLLLVATTPTTPSSPVTVALHAISSDRSTQTHHLETLTTWTLPDTLSPLHCGKKEEPKYSFDTKTGIFQAILNGRIASCDLTGLQPFQLPEFQHREYHLNEFLQLSPSLALAASQVHYGLYNTEYNALLSARPLPSLQGPNPKKRKQPGDEHTSCQLMFVTWFSKLGFALAIVGNSLVSIPVDGRQDRNKHQRLAEPRLIDIIGKGLQSGAVQKPTLEDRNYRADALGAPFEDSEYLGHQNWQQHVVTLTRLVHDGNVTGFERDFAWDVGLYNIFDRPSADDIAREGPTLFKLKKLPPETYIPLHRPQALFALGQIFRRRSKGAGRVEIAFYPPNVFRWLSLTGQLAPELIDQALRMRGKFIADAMPISGADLVAAIVTFDPSFQLLDEILLEHPHLELDTLVQAAKYILRSLDDGSTDPLPTQLLIDGTGAAAKTKTAKTAKPLAAGEPKKTLANGDKKHGTENTVEDSLEDDSQTILPEVEAASADLNLANTMLECGLPLRSEPLRLALTKIDAHPTQAIVRKMSEVMSRKELVFLINLLRIELSDGGWHFRYIDAEREVEGEDMIPGSMGLVTRLLGCCADAIGVGDWLGAGKTDGNGMAQVLTGLRAEVNDVLEGIHEATFLKGLLGEFLRFGWKRDNADLKHHGESKGIKVVSMEGGENRSREGDGKELPMGLKVKRGVDTKVVDKGEIKDRRKRDVGNEISKGVGKYAYEEIRF